MEHWAGAKTSEVRRLVSAAVRRPGRTVAVWLAIAAVASLGLIELSIDTAIRNALNREGPAWATYLRSLDRRHGGDEFITAAIENLGRLTAGVVALCLLAGLTLLSPLLLAGSDRNLG